MNHYDPSCFNVRTVDEAKAIILTPEDSTTDRRWATETPYLGKLMQQHLALHPRHRVLDYGCGIGRMGKELIDRYGCSVVGVDTSVSMRALAPAYVRSDRFMACAPASLDLVASTHFAIAVWVLQHIPDVDRAIWEIANKLRSFGSLFVVNAEVRCLPSSEGAWTDDGKDVRELLGRRFTETAFGKLDALQTSPETARGSFWGVYQLRL